ncbi:MAG: hypothetical protein ACXWLH_01850 [Candidatus Saccharimonadales bacterium]
MANTFWHKQSADQPAFPDLLWSRPQSKQSAGKLLIIGGNIHSFAAVGQAYQQAAKAGIGKARVMLPDSLQKTVSKLLPEADFAASTPSGSFGQKALAEWLDVAAWADGVLIAGDLARNSETAIVLEKFTDKFNGQLTLTKDAVDYFTHMPGVVLARPQTLLVATMAQLQLLAGNSKSSQVFKFDSDLLQLVENLHTFTTQHQASIIIKHLDTIFAAAAGQVSTTKTDIKDEDSWRLPTAASAAVWWLQNPTKTFEALTTAITSHG